MSQPHYQSREAAEIVASRIRQIATRSLPNFGLDASRCEVAPWHTGGGIWCAAVIVDGELLADAGPAVDHLAEEDPWNEECIGVDWYVLTDSTEPGDRTEYDRSDYATTPSDVVLAVIELLQEGGFRE